MARLPRGEAENFAPPFRVGADGNGHRDRDGEGGPWRQWRRGPPSALDVGFLNNRDQRFLGRLARLEESREVAPLAQLGDL